MVDLMEHAAIKRARLHVLANAEHQSSESLVKAFSHLSQRQQMSEMDQDDFTCWENYCG